MGTYNDPRATEISDLLENLNLPVRWLARKLEVHHTTLRAWLSGDNRPRDPAIFDRALEIVKTDGFEERGIRVGKEVERIIPVYGALPAGRPGTFSGDATPERFPYAGRADVPLWGRIISGDSMLPVFETGDIAVFHGVPPESSQVGHFFNNNAEELIKCYRSPGGNKELWSFNPEFLPMSAENWTGKGTCIGRIRKGPYGVVLVAKFGDALTWSMRDMKL